MQLKLGLNVGHKDIYNGKEVMTIVGIKENEVLLEGDFSGGTHHAIGQSWMSIDGLIECDTKQKNKTHLQILIEKSNDESEENRRKSISNIGKDAKDCEPYDNKAYLEMVSYAKKLMTI